MAINIGDNFNYQGSKPLDARTKFDSVDAMKDYPETSLYDGIICYETSTGKNFQYKSDNTVDVNYGKWRVFSSGGSGGSYVAGTGISISIQDEIGIKEMGNTDMMDVVNPLPSGGGGTTGTIVVANPEGTVDTDLTKLQVGGTVYSIPEGGSDVVANPESEATDNLTKLEVDGTVYNISGGGGGHVILDENGDELTQRDTLAPIFPLKASDNDTDEQTGLEVDTDTDFSNVPVPSYVPPSYLVVGGKYSKVDLYDTTEKVVGKWTNGKPVYQKTVTVSIAQAGWNSQAHGVLNIDTVVKAEGLIDMGNGTFYSLTGYRDDTLQGYLQVQSTTVGVFVGTYSSYLSKTAKVTIQYTKTTDQADSFNYSDPNDYSTDEKIIGTWVDGKPVYQKTWTGLSLSISYNSFTNTGISATTIDTIVDARGVDPNSNFSGTFIASTYGQGSAHTTIGLSTPRNAANVQLAILTVQYTKTTD